MAKVMNHRIEKLYSLLDAYESQLNVENKSEIAFEHETAANKASENYSCSPTIKIEPLLMSNSNGFRVHSSTKNICETFKKRFSSPSQLNIHKRIHSKQKPFACIQCKKTFSLKSNLSKHTRRIHTGEKPHHCDLCPKKFAQSSGLRRHEIIHSGEKPYCCVTCDQKFARLGDLVRHKRLHTGEKPFSCDICPKKFARSDSLTDHKRIHTGDKPYDCDMCPKKFARSNHLKRHKKIHTV
jgi:uncharacterized Zn-finger protein